MLTPNTRSAPVTRSQNQHTCCTPVPFTKRHHPDYARGAPDCARLRSRPSDHDTSLMGKGASKLRRFGLPGESRRRRIGVFTRNSTRNTYSLENTAYIVSIYADEFDKVFGTGRRLRRNTWRMYAGVRLRILGNVGLKIGSRITPPTEILRGRGHGRTIVQLSEKQYVRGNR